jgi:hypothetical protein
MFICAKSPVRLTNQKIRISSRASTASTLFQQPPIDTRSTNILEQAGEKTMRTTQALSKIKLSDCEGTTRALDRYWKEQPVVLVFIRHFG